MNNLYVITMTAHNDEAFIGRAIQSFLAQKNYSASWKLVISVDSSTDSTADRIHQFIPAGNIDIIYNTFGNIAANRNFLLDYVRSHYPDTALIGRLDADDEIAGTDVFVQIEKIFEEHRCEILLMSNYQRKEDQVLPFVNKPGDELLTEEGLLNRLEKMTQLEWNAELPSCNAFFSPAVPVYYRDIPSAEDHYLFTDLLLLKNRNRIKLAGEINYCYYSIKGKATTINLQNNSYRDARIKLLEYARRQMETERRYQSALNLLLAYHRAEYQYLGAGFSGVVFHDGVYVYKVHIPIASNNYNEIDSILYLAGKLEIFKNRKHFYPLKSLVKFNGVYILIYPFEHSHKVNALTASDMISFLAEMWEMKIVCKSITKTNNFIRVGSVVRLIDYEIEPYNDNLFLNVVARAYIQLEDNSRKKQNYDKLKRSIINQFDLPELKGLYHFCEEVFLCATRKKLKTQQHIICRKEQEQDSCFIYDGVSGPSVALLIKACIQDSESLFEQVCHIVSQLQSDTRFSKRFLLLDCYREDQFLRQYTDQGSEKVLLSEASRLVDCGYIDELIIPPADEALISRTNRDWFAIASSHTHTSSGIPLVSQLYAFDQIKADYILQADVDVLVGRKSKNHDFMDEPVRFMQSHPDVVSWGVQIYHSDQTSPQEIFSNEKIRPDPRFSLLCCARLQALKPLPNNVTANGPELAWYQSLFTKMTAGGIRCARGGGFDTFYIHPQNYRKVSPKVMYWLMNSVERGLIPEIQSGQPEIRGSVYDWTLPRRNENLVVILSLQNPVSGFANESLFSILNQTGVDFGIIVINNSGERISLKIPEEYSSATDKITLINYNTKKPATEVVYDAIHYYMQNSESFICLIMEGDVLIDETVLSETMHRMALYQADVLIGKAFDEKALKTAGLSAVNFINPRAGDANIENGLQVFSKSLFDALSHFDLKYKHTSDKHLQEFKKIRKHYSWIDDSENRVILAPIIELATNPIRFDHFNIVRRARHDVSLRQMVQELLQSNTPKKEGALNYGRKTFLPNLNRIELDITYDCNLKCFHCNRSCTQAPTTAHMSLDQILQFIEESKSLHKKWELINILGGEPTLHPDFHTIVNSILFNYIIPFSPETTLQVTSNGFGEAVMDALRKLPDHANLIIDSNSFKTDRVVPYFTPFNQAPVDTSDFTEKDYMKGCWVTSYCGIGLNHLGYFPCGIAGGIERVRQNGMGLQSLHDVDETIRYMLPQYCSLCGNFLDYHVKGGDFIPREEKDNISKAAEMTETWKKLYKQYNGKK